PHKTSSNRRGCRSVHDARDLHFAGVSLPAARVIMRDWKEVSRADPSARYPAPQPQSEVVIRVGLKLLAAPCVFAAGGHAVDNVAEVVGTSAIAGAQSLCGDQGGVAKPSVQSLRFHPVAGAAWSVSMWSTTLVICAQPPHRYGAAIGCLE